MYQKIFASMLAVGLLTASSFGSAEEENIRRSLKNVLPDMEATAISESAIPGIYTVLYGAEIFYVTADGRYLFRGDLIDIDNRANLSEDDRTIARRGMLSEVKDADVIAFPASKPQHTIYVFTDITCGFCQKLQHDIKDINNLGISVKYLAFPREGSASATSRRMESVWCSDNRQDALTDAMIGLGVREETCDNPVNEQFALGQSLGIRGTPAIFTEDGRYLPGYLPPGELLKAIIADNNQ